MKKFPLLVDFLEQMLITELEMYESGNRANVPTPENYSHYDNSIGDEMYKIYTFTILEHLRLTSKSDHTRFLEESYMQFHTHTPEKRIDAIYKLYEKTWAPADQPIDPANKLMLRPAMNAYKKHFIKYKKFAFHLLNDYKNGTLDLTAHNFEDLNIPQIQARQPRPEHHFSSDHKTVENEIPPKDDQAALKLGRQINIGKVRTPGLQIIPDAYTYINFNTNISAITDLLEFLKKNAFIAEDTRISDFRNIFNNKKPVSPIRWKGNLSELTHFIKLLHLEKKLILPLKNNVWKITAGLFIDAKGKIFDSSRFKGQKIPANANLLERAANLLS